MHIFMLTVRCRQVLIKIGIYREGLLKVCSIKLNEHCSADQECLQADTETDRHGDAKTPIYTHFRSKYSETCVRILPCIPVGWQSKH
jgi:hypothetical protein